MSYTLYCDISELKLRFSGTSGKLVGYVGVSFGWVINAIFVHVIAQLRKYKMSKVDTWHLSIV